MYNPERRVKQCNSLNQDCVAAYKIDKLRSHSILLNHSSLFNRYFHLCPSEKLLSSTISLCNHSRFPSVSRSSAHCPPIIISCLTINNTFSCYCNICLTICIYKRMSIIAIQSFPSCKHCWEI